MAQRYEFYVPVAETTDISLLQGEHKIHIFEPRCNVLFIIRRPDVLDNCRSLFHCFRINEQAIEIIVRIQRKHKALLPFDIEELILISQLINSLVFFLLNYTVFKRKFHSYTEVRFEKILSIGMRDGMLSNVACCSRFYTTQSRCDVFDYTAQII